MSLATWIELITLALKFPAAVMSLVRLLQKTPEAKHDELVAAIQKEADEFEKTGRPKWD